ncbi:MAG: hypothetical protein RJB39_424 [Candidatus Parcubacteria bacterium]|jgi:prepilin-type N-terminal cleavage/methylation domain-containing protein
MKNIYKKYKGQRGFTLIEILVVIGIIGILAAVVLVAVSPGRQFKQARDSQRVANVNTILNAVGQNIADHQGTLQCDGDPAILPDEPTRIGTNTGQFGLATCLVPDYLPKLPYDPTPGRGSYESEDTYDLAYDISQDQQGRITVSATGEIQPIISVSR